MTPREMMDVVNNAAETFQDFEWRLTSGAVRTWYWWNEDHVEYNVGSHNYEPVYGVEITCLYCPEAGSINDRVFQTQVFTRLLLDEIRPPEMKLVLQDMALKILAETENME